VNRDPNRTFVRGHGVPGQTKSVDNNFINNAGLLSDFVPITVTAGVSPTTLNGIATGTSFFNRIGRKVCMKTLSMNGIIIPTQNNANIPGQVIRYVVVYDKQSNSTTPPLFTSVFKSYDNGGTPSNHVTDFANPDNRDRFIILLDQSIAISQINNVTSTPAPVIGGVDKNTNRLSVKHLIKLKNMEAQYADDTNGVAQTGALYLYLASNAPTTLGVGLSDFGFTGTLRLRFQDN